MNDEFGINYEENGVLTVKEEDRVVMGKGPWVTVLYSFREWQEPKGEYGPLKASIRRYHKQNGAYRVQSRFNINNAAQATAISKALAKWFESGGEENESESAE